MRLYAHINLSSVQSIAAGAMQTNSGILLYDFRQSQQVPTLANANAFTNMNNNAKFVVPDGLYDDWVAETNWSTYADKIVKASEYGN